MNKIIISIMLLLLSSLAFASIWDSDYQGIKWHTNYQQAKRVAAEKNRPILIYFSGSDWCSFCIRLDKKVLTKTDFQAYAQQHLILLNLDFPQEKELPADLAKQNKELFNRFKPGGFPYFVVLSSKTDQVMGAFGFHCLPLICSKSSFIKKITKITAQE